ncbi:MAG: outer membrane lipoprotein chaperone LolA [Nitrospinaceae bacterium]|nr:outer membrane lipoprotein chaperone LolA [Nitrospinaceae bacterium]NIR55078.1 outer membrane lipoprotein chaperone LolA [Nitrospinaceae bacterium]NIS85487.1 outer membrane lipoprotein chaperone LolA [Nitrospinaceae bacterium]NIT82325.1 outer membrane lipoprotein chaperone LolA [Nitrospinaceae bacterium]NIU44543.1 outer membrane lipoprotein chaperone LolA [Nitrospinaceae bacterium]
MRTKISLCLFLLILIFPLRLAAESKEQAAIDAIQKRYEEVRTFQSDFVQKSYVKMMNQTQKAEGRVHIKKPGKMKWVYNAPDPQVLVSNRETLWLYVPEDEQVTKVPIKNIYSSNTPALFLAGKGKLLDTFEVLQVIFRDQEVQVTLAPKNEENNLERLVLYADKKNYQIVGSSVYDKLGNRTEIRFRNIQVNREIPDQMFEFSVPQGVELLDYTEKP